MSINMFLQMSSSFLKETELNEPHVDVWQRLLKAVSVVTRPWKGSHTFRLGNWTIGICNILNSFIKVNSNNWSAHRWSLNLVYTPTTHHRNSPLACEDDICTTSPWIPYNLFSLYVQAVHNSSQYNCTVVQLYSCTVVKLYSHTVVQSPSP